MNHSLSLEGKHFTETMWYLISQMSFEQKLFLISAAVAVIASFYLIIISPIIFNYFLIPKIEKKIKKKLESHTLLRYLFLGKWMFQQNEIAIYLINRYFAYKFNGDRGLPRYCNKFGLKKVGYTIDMMSRDEIIASFMWLMSIVLTVFFGITACILSNQFSVVR